MNAARHIARLNRLLLAELGSHPPYQWIYSESAEFRRPMRAMDEDGNLQWDYQCPCGRNAAVHTASCVAGGLVVVVPVWDVRRTDPDLHNQWVLCCLQEPMSEYEWGRVFGTVLPWPRNGSWAPVCTETHTVAMKPDTLPGDNFTLAIIAGRRRSREVRMRDVANEIAWKDAKKDAQRRVTAAQRLEDVLTHAKGTVVFGGDDGPSPALRRKIEQGESLVTI